MTEAKKNWPQLFDELAKDRKISLRGLAIQLGVAQSTLAQVMQGGAAPSPWLKFRYFGLTGWTGSIEQITALLPEDLQQAIKNHDAVGMQKLGAKADETARIRENKAALRKEKENKISRMQ